MQENWLRLDFNQDGSVGMDDLRKSVTKLYDFLQNFEYLEATTKIKSQIYAEAIKKLPLTLQSSETNEANAID